MSNPNVVPPVIPCEHGVISRRFECPECKGEPLAVALVRESVLCDICDEPEWAHLMRRAAIELSKSYRSSIELSKHYDH